MKFLDAILTNNSTDDHCKEFVSQKGIQALMKILCLPNLPLDFPQSPACHAVAGVCKSLVSLTHDFAVMKDGLQSLKLTLNEVDTWYSSLDAGGGSAILRELASCPNPMQALNDPKLTPLAHVLAAVHAHVLMFSALSRIGMVSLTSYLIYGICIIRDASSKIVMPDIKIIS
jgi:E3 ubiquitin-protein ligase HUWE1